MTYLPPSYSDLKTSTRTLTDKFNQVSMRYIPPEYTKLCDAIEKLDIIYTDRIKKRKTSLSSIFKPNNESIRYEQIHSLKVLSSSLKAFKDITLARDILLGGCFYRLIRLLKVSRSESQLANILLHFLGINKNNELDDATLVCCCEAYHTHLEILPIEDQKIYLEANPNLYKKLDKLINKHKEYTDCIFRQLDAVKFIQSIAAALQRVEEEFAKVITTLQPEFDKISESLVLNEKRYIHEDLSNVHDPVLKAIIHGFELLPNQISCKGVPVEQDGTMNYYSFRDFILFKLDLVCEDILFGAYLITLSLDYDLSSLPKREKEPKYVKHISPSKKKLSSLDNISLPQTLKSLLNITTQNIFDPKNDPDDLNRKIRSLQTLQKFNEIMQQTGSPWEINYLAWNGIGHFNQAIQKEITLSQEVEPSASRSGYSFAS